MVSTAITQAIIAGIGTIILALGGGIIAVWRHLETNIHDGEDADKIEDLQSYRWGAVSSEIQSLYIDVDNYLSENPFEEQEDIEYEAHLTNVIRDGVDLRDIEDLIGEARGMDEPSRLYKEHESEYEKCLWYFIYSAGSLFILDTSIVVGLIAELGPFEGVYVLLNAILGGLAILTLYDAFKHLEEARNKKKEFDKLWEEYRYDY